MIDGHDDPLDTDGVIGAGREPVTFRVVLEVLRALRKQEGEQLPQLLTLQAVVGVLNGVGLILIIPLITMLDKPNRNLTGSRVRGAVIDMFRSLGISISLGSVIVILTALLVVTAVLNEQQALVITRVELAFTNNLRTQLLAAMQRADWAVVSRTRSEDLHELLTTGLSSAGRMAVAVLHLVAGGFVLFVYLVVAVALSPLITLVVSLAGIFLFFRARRQVRRTHELSHEVGLANQRLRRSVQRSLDGLLLSRVFSEGTEDLHEVGDGAREYGLRRKALVSQQAGSQRMFTIGAALSLAMLLWLAADVVNVPTPDLVVLVIVFARVLPRARFVQHSHQQTVALYPTYLRVIDTLERLRAADEAPGLLAPPPPLPVRTAVELDGVGYRYPQRAKKALDGVSVRIPAHQITALVGPSGAGKSTTADVLIGLLAPQDGRVVVDGAVLDEVGRVALRRAAAYVPQRVVLFPGTVRDNVRFGRVADDEDVWHALELAHADEFVRHLPKGLETMLRPEARNLSGGERQRLSIARALLVDPEVLVLDEPVSAIDPDGVRALREVLAGLRERMTIVVISHRRALLSVADHVVVLRTGTVAAAGSPVELADHPDERVRRLVRPHPLG